MCVNEPPAKRLLSAANMVKQETGMDLNICGFRFRHKERLGGREDRLPLAVDPNDAPTAE